MEKDSEEPDDFAGRVGRYVLLRDREGLRHAIRSGAIVAISDADGGADMTVVVVQGGRVLIVLSPLEQVLGWLD